MQYVLGFAFNSHKDSVLLVKKKFGPKVNIGRLNGVGGELKSDEKPSDAMEREFKEKTGCTAIWERIGTLVGEGWLVYIYKGKDVIGTTPNENDIGEQLYWVDVNEMLDASYETYAPNALTIIAHALYGDGTINFERLLQPIS